MALVIWKFKMEITDFQALEMPVDSQPLDVQVQAGVICLWALCDREKRRERRGFAMYGTGFRIPRASRVGDYLATFQLDGGALVFHVFDLGHVASPESF